PPSGVELSSRYLDDRPGEFAGGPGIKISKRAKGAEVDAPEGSDYEGLLFQRSRPPTECPMTACRTILSVCGSLPSDGVRSGAYWAERHGAAGHWEEL